jgi:hypothetical protein
MIACKVPESFSHIVCRVVEWDESFNIQGGRSLRDPEEKCERILPLMIYSLDEFSLQSIFF